QDGTQDLTGRCPHDQKRAKMVQDQVLQTMCKEQALGVVVDARVQGKIQQDKAEPEQYLARCGYPMDTGTAHEQHAGSYERNNEGWGELPGYEPAKIHE